jgi:hypothetical protein
LSKILELRVTERGRRGRGASEEFFNFSNFGIGGKE